MRIFNMKRLNFLPFLLCMLFAACVQKENFPSPLEGVHIDNQSFDSESSKLTLEVNSSLANVQAEVLDMETMDFADWLKVDVARQKLTLTITDNITTKERTARVTLYTIDRDDVDNNSLTVVFYVTQTKNTQFDGLELEEVVVDHQRCDTVVVLEHVLRNVKATVTDLEGNKADWVKTTVGTNYLGLVISEHVSKGERQALIRLQPSSKTQVADSLLAGTNFLITQRHNPVLDSLTIEPQNLSSESGRHIIHTDRLLTNIRALAIDDSTAQKANWLTIAVAGDSITLTTTAHTQQADRTATVTLYLPNHGDVIDSTTISLPFTIKQSHNNIFDGANYHHRYVEWNQTGDTLKLNRELKDVKCQLTDTLTHKNPTWLSASVEGKNVVFKPSKLTAKTDRTVQVTLYMGTLNEQAVQTSFYVTQRHNNIFDGEPFHDRSAEWNQKNDTLKLTRELTDIKCNLADNVTKQNPSWLSATVTGKDVIFTVQNNTSKQERTATVTLYLPNGSTIDANTIKTSFQFKQTGNTFFNGVKFDDLVVLWNQSLVELPASFDLRQVKSKLVDIATNKAPNWLSVSFDLDNNTIELKPSQLNTTDDRAATVTLYIPNGNIIDENTEQISFKLTQHHNNIFDGEPFRDRQVNWDEKYDTLKLTRELTSIKWQLTDNETQKSPTWLQAIINGKNVEFTAQTNYSKYPRSASVILYLPNGTTINAKTVHTTFNFTQKGNDLLDSLNIDDRTMAWNLTSDKITTKVDMTNVKCQVVDNATQNTPNWLKVTLKGNSIELQPSKLTTGQDRSATLTFFVNGTTLNANTPQKSFKLTQKHNNIFDGVSYHNRSVAYNQKADTLKLTRELTDIRCQLTDNETQLAARWIRATVSGNMVIFSIDANTTLASRSATATLYLPNGSSIADSEIKTSFQIEQDFERKVIFEKNKIEVNYAHQDYDVSVTSNTKYQIVTPTWVKCVMTPESETKEKLTLTFEENMTNRVREDTLRLTSGGTEVAKMALRQRTNPKIEINFDDQRKLMAFHKDGGVFNLPVKTLTPNYRITKSGNWIIVDNKQTENNTGNPELTDQYYHQVRVPYFSEAEFERFDTLVISNAEDTVRFPIKQHKYIYLEESAQQELEIGHTLQLHQHKHPKISNNVSWSSSNKSIVTVDQTGLVTTNGKTGTAKITISIGPYEGEQDYNDYTNVWVYDVPDKIELKRGLGNYEMEKDSVTANCPVSITNNYRASITLTDVHIENSQQQTVAKCDTCTLYPNEKKTLTLSKNLIKVHKPKIVLKFTCNDKPYTKYVNY